MKSKRRNFTAEFKAQVAIEALKGQETLAQLSERFNVSSVMISNWKSEFLKNASAAFTEKKRDDAKDKELELCHSKIGRLEMKLDFAKRASKALGIHDARRRLISPHSGLSLNEQLELLSISKGCYYYKPVGMDPETHKIMKFIDEEHLRFLGKGVVGMRDSSNAIEVLERAIGQYGVPEILNSDQGSQYTCKEWIDSLNKHNIAVSMDGKGRCKDNIRIERFWRTIKNEYIYFHPFENGLKMREGIRWYITYYNNRRPHQGIEHKIPKKCIFVQKYRKWLD